jgi:hypothetical protein
MTNFGNINQIVDMQVALYEMRKSRIFPFSKEIFVSKPEPKLTLIIDLHLGYCREEIELHKEFGNPYYKRKWPCSLDYKL